MQKFTPKQVSDYYNEMTPSYLQIYGDVIQAFRPENTEKLLDYIGRSAGINWNMHVLDLGCGVAGPAIHFVKRWNANVDGVTISEIQLIEGNKKIAQAGVEQKIHLYQGDYHHLEFLPLQNDYYDVVLFLESLGHSDNIELAIKNASSKLKTGGALYIKDFYKKYSNDVHEQAKIDKIIANIDRNYAYNTLDLNELKLVLKNQGFTIEFLKAFDFIDDIKVRYEFEKELKIDIFEGLDINPADWLELKAIKQITL